MSTAVHCTPLNIQIAAREFFVHFSESPWSMLLDSGLSQHVDATIDVIVFSPIITLVSDNEQTKVSNIATGMSYHSADNPFDVLQHELSHCGLSKDKSTFSFSGGAVGHFSYDLARRAETLAEVAKQDIDLPVMAVGIYEHAIIFDKKLPRPQLVSRGSLKQHQQMLQTLNALVVSEQRTSYRLTTPWQHQITKQQYSDKFNQIQQHLRAGDCYQINLTQRFNAGFKGNEYQAYLDIAQQNNTPFSAFIRLPNAAILSVSPERFLQCHQGIIETKPIKGTRPRSEDPIEDNRLAIELKESEKDQSENLMIVDLLRNDIGRSAIAGSVAVPTLFAIESFKNVHHLVSTITAKLPQHISPITLLKNAFPGGSITGAPKISAMNIIDALEPSRRSIYCGSIGYISCDLQMDTNITIRTLLCTEQQIYCWAGGGIIADSEVDAEYQECFDKVASILPILYPKSLELQ